MAWRRKSELIKPVENMAAPNTLEVTDKLENFRKRWDNLQGMSKKPEDLHKCKNRHPFEYVWRLEQSAAQ